MLSAGSMIPQLFHYPLFLSNLQLVLHFSFQNLKRHFSIFHSISFLFKKINIITSSPHDKHMNVSMPPYKQRPFSLIFQKRGVFTIYLLMCLSYFKPIFNHIPITAGHPQPPQYTGFLFHGTCPRLLLLQSLDQAEFSQIPSKTAH